MRLTAFEKEKRKLEKEEIRRLRQAFKKSDRNLMHQIQTKIPDKVNESLRKAFLKAFEIVLEKGVGIIEKTYNKEDLQKTFEIHDFAVQKKGKRKEYRNLHKQAINSGRLNMLLSTVEGVALGALGIGLPDIVLFTGMLMKGAYETALHYGFDYEKETERYLILQFMEVSLLKENAYMERNEKINQMIETNTMCIPTEEVMKAQMEKTADAMATDMLVMKFVQGLPLVGFVGGVMNPVYYEKIVGYIQLKYQRRYLSDLQRRQLDL